MAHGSSYKKDYSSFGENPRKTLFFFLQFRLQFICIMILNNSRKSIIEKHNTNKLQPNLKKKEERFSWIFPKTGVTFVVRRTMCRFE